MKKIDVLPDQMYLFKAPDELTEKALDLLRREEFNPNQVNYLSKDITLHRREEYKELVQWGNSCFQQLKEDLSLHCQYMKVCQMWGTKTPKGHWHHSHNHYNSWASGILYLNESSAQTWFSAINFWPHDFSMSVIGEDNDCAKYFKFTTEPGTMIVFPSNLMHSVNEHDRDEDRYILGMNAMPCGLVGIPGNTAATLIEVL